MNTKNKVTLMNTTTANLSELENNLRDDFEKNMFKNIDFMEDTYECNVSVLETATTKIYNKIREIITPASYISQSKKNKAQVCALPINSSQINIWNELLNFKKSIVKSINSIYMEKSTSNIKMFQVFFTHQFKLDFDILYNKLKTILLNHYDKNSIDSSIIHFKHAKAKNYKLKLHNKLLLSKLYKLQRQINAHSINKIKKEMEIIQTELIMLKKKIDTYRQGLVANSI